MNSPYRALFDLQPGLIYLNAGSVSISPRSITEAKLRHYREGELNPTKTLWETWPRLWECQKELGLLLGADPRALFLRTNVTNAMNAFLLGLDHLSADGREPPPGEILVSNHEYGAVVNIARFRAERDGHTMRTFSLTESPEALARLSSAEIAQLILAQIRPETRLLLLSHVLTSTGMILPIREIARETRRRGVLLAVDGAHATGAIPMSFDGEGGLEDVDFYGGNLHKWTLGPKGTGYGWVPKRHHARMTGLEAGWTTFESNDPFHAFGEADRFQGRMLMSSSQDFSSFFAIPDVRDFWQKHGTEGPAQHRATLRRRLRAGIAERLGWKCLSPEGALEGPLLTWELPAALQVRGRAIMGELLEKKNLQVVINRVCDRACLRLAPALHNTLEEMDLAVEMIAECLGQNA